MYIPVYSSITDRNIIKDFILKYSFGTLINGTEGRINANHYPFLFTEEAEHWTLWTHMAKSNPQWKELDNTSCLAIFVGPHGYISPSYYVNKLNVPTWNYTAVHLNCQASVVIDSLLGNQLMQKIVTFYENKYQTDWDYKLPQDFHDQLMKAIVWIKLDVKRIEAKFKLSQNREAEDYQGVLDNLSNNQDLLDYMNKVKR